MAVSFRSLMTSDEYKPYREAILEVYGETYPRRRKGRIGRNPKPGRRPPAGLLYATVHKHRRRARVVRVSTHIVYGGQKALPQALAVSACSRSVNIAFVERYNGTDRLSLLKLDGQATQKMAQERLASIQ